MLRVAVTRHEMKGDDESSGTTFEAVQAPGLLQVRSLQVALWLALVPFIWLPLAVHALRGGSPALDWTILAGALAAAAALVMAITAARRASDRRVALPITLTQTHVVHGGTRVSVSRASITLAPWFPAGHAGTMLVLDDGKRRLKIVALGHRLEPGVPIVAPRMDLADVCLASPSLFDELLARLGQRVAPPRSAPMTAYRTPDPDASGAGPPIRRMLLSTGAVSRLPFILLTTVPGVGAHFVVRVLEAGVELASGVILFGLSLLALFAANRARTGRAFLGSERLVTRPNVWELYARGPALRLENDGVVYGRTRDARASARYTDDAKGKVITVRLGAHSEMRLVRGELGRPPREGDYLVGPEDFEWLLEHLELVKTPPGTRVAEVDDSSDVTPVSASAVAGERGAR